MHTHTLTGGSDDRIPAKDTMSPRKKKTRNCTCPLRENVGSIFNPAGSPFRELEIVVLERDELEALYLCDGQDLHQEQAGELMGVSRGTVQRLLAGARKKIVEVLVGQKALAVIGETPIMPAPDSAGRAMAAQGSNTCDKSSGPCQGPLSCPWRSQDAELT